MKHPLGSTRYLITPGLAIPQNTAVRLLEADTRFDEACYCVQALGGGVKLYVYESELSKEKK